MRIELAVVAFIISGDMATTAEIAKLLTGEVIGDPDIVLTGFATADRAKAGDLTFAETEEYFAAAENSAASAIIADQRFSSDKKILIRVPNARIASAKAVAFFFPEPEFAAGIHPTAIIAASATVDPSAHVGPYCHVGERVTLGAKVVLQSGNSIGADSTLGDGTNLFPNVTIYPRTQIGQRVRIHANCVIGADGFGYVYDSGVHRKIPQIGNVVIGDDVEIGAGSTVDRGALGSTTVGKGTKIDNLVQVGHNVQIGDYGMICAQTGIAGSVKLGHHVVLAGQVGLAGHLKIGDNVTIGSKSGVMHNIPDGETWLGLPAQPDKQAKRIVIAIQRLPDLLKKVAMWEKKLGGTE